MSPNECSSHRQKAVFLALALYAAAVMGKNDVISEITPLRQREAANVEENG